MTLRIFALIVTTLLLPTLVQSDVLWQKPSAKDSETTTDTPVASDPSLMPKVETQALEFLSRHPQSDGRGVVVAIFDTGVDPGAAGLSKTSDGRPKVIDMIDGTGSGDVKMTTTRKAEDGKLLGLSGRELSISPKWKNPSGEYHLGLKAAFDLFPKESGELVTTIRKDRTEKFIKQQRIRRAKLDQTLAEWKVKHPKPEGKQKKKTEELEARIKLLDDMVAGYKDAGPIYDCLTFHDGKTWRAVIDTDEDGNLAEEKVLTNFRAERQYGTFPEPVNMNFAVNVYEKGKLISIVNDCGAHGTHVAGIVSAYFPDQPELNGVAPGAQIVSVKIGDTRLDGMESGLGLVRGLRAVLDNDCDLINMSYGESASVDNVGRVTDLFSEVVNEHGVIFVSSAGNSGPALSTVGAPGGTTSAIIGVGAYVSPEMMKSEYSLRQDLPGLPYTWTSRGPTRDGDLGIDIFAPGGAIAPVPQWTRQRSQLMNGTSMASPNACGNLALLLSAAKQKKLPYNPHSIERVMQNSAKPLDHAEVFAEGPGLIQVLDAWNLLEQSAETLAQQLNYEIKVPALHNARGIYLRDPVQTETASSYRVYVTPKLNKKATNDDRLAIAEDLVLKTTDPWIDCGDSLYLTHGGNRFTVEVQPEGLTHGAWYGEVQAFSRGQEELGPVFRVPITVIIPERIYDDEPELSQTTTFQPGQILRQFIAPPAGSSSAVLTMKLIDTDEPKFFRVHTLQLLDGHRFNHTESGTYYALKPGLESTHSFPVVEERLLEVDLAQYWSILGESRVEWKIEFNGPTLNENVLSLATGQGFAEFEVVNSLRPIKIKPSASLKTWRRTVLPGEAKIMALSDDRSRLPDGSPAFELNIEYSFKQESPASVTPRFPGWKDLLYESPTGPFIYDILNENGERVVTNDIFADPVKLEKGAYRLILKTQHRDPQVLKKQEKLPLAIDQSLKSPISLSFTSSPVENLAGEGGHLPSSLKTNQSLTIYLQEPPYSKLPSTLGVGDQLLGEFSVSADDDHKSHHHVVYSKTASAAKSASTGANGSTKKTSLEEQIRDLQLKHMKTLDVTSEEFQALFEKLRKSDEADRQPLVIRLHLLDDEKKRKERLTDVVSAADDVIGSIDHDLILMTLAKRELKDDKTQKEDRQKAEDAKKDLIDALYRKVRALAYMELPEVLEKKPIADQKQHNQEFQKAYEALEAWVDPEDKDYFLVVVRKLRRAGHYAKAILLLNQKIKDDDQLLYLKKRRDLFDELKWDDWAKWQERWLLRLYPQKHPPY